MEVPKGSREDRSVCLARTMDKLRRSGALCDVNINVGQRVFACHRCALAVSPVFEAMFTGKMKEKDQGEVRIEEMQPETFEQLILFIYASDDFRLTDQNAWQLLFAANRYRVREILEVTIVISLTFLNFFRSRAVRHCKVISLERLLSMLVMFSQLGLVISAMEALGRPLLGNAFAKKHFRSSGSFTLQTPVGLID